MTSLLVLAEGRFGLATAEILASDPKTGTRRLVGSGRPLAGHTAGEGFVAVPLWRPFDAECDRLDRDCWQLGIAWSAAYPFERELVCGPLVVPGHGPCYQCFRRRQLTHRPHPERETYLHAAYAANDTMGPPGFLPPMAWLAAAALRDDASAGPEAAGRLRVVDLVTGDVREHRVVPIHGCRRCGPGAPVRPGARFVDHLAPRLEAERARRRRSRDDRIAR